MQNNGGDRDGAVQCCVITYEQITQPFLCHLQCCTFGVIGFGCFTLDQAHGMQQRLDWLTAARSARLGVRMQSAGDWLSVPSSVSASRCTDEPNETQFRFFRAWLRRRCPVGACLPGMEHGGVRLYLHARCAGGRSSLQWEHGNRLACKRRYSPLLRLAAYCMI
jgi:hypothetical protein